MSTRAFRRLSRAERRGFINTIEDPLTRRAFEIVFLGPGKVSWQKAALLYGGMAGLGSGQVWEAVGCAVPILVSAFVILYLYNGRRAARGRTFYKWFFYAFYPAHLLVLGLLRLAV